MSTTQIATPASHWDIFCTVVDNYGDIGVTWRLAKQLAAEYHIKVNLWVDDLHSFSHILPNLIATKRQQTFNGVNIFQWNNPLDIEYQAGSVIIEAFACELPEQVKTIIEQRHKQSKSLAPHWLNLEYLSAEDWVDGCHGLPSTQVNGVKKWFYFPGFNRKTGGLICEQHLFKEREQWQSDLNNKMTLFKQLGLTGINHHDTVISVFSYETEALTALIRLWQTSTTAIHVLIPKGRSLTSVAPFIPGETNNLMPGQQFKLGNLTLHILPMTDQTGFDRLLWSCDFNIVRGEDSFLRAQWAAKPFIWHIYPQEDDYHLVKLEAFMKIYCDNLAAEISTAWCKLNLAFNQDDQHAVVNHWQQLNSVILPLQQHALNWPNNALDDADLASRLVQFVKNS
ncbi:elongation factor P maturation arginine rhamnosyltransferase EarP [Shewanella sp.]|uniref:elongation factor P maturation arginine rhamnosyltransferase EarP n=1 Tax=Shewanella sp. TaxID=50422 RepID=UPI00404806E4